MKKCVQCRRVIEKSIPLAVCCGGKRESVCVYACECVCVCVYVFTPTREGVNLCVLLCASEMIF